MTYYIYAPVINLRILKDQHSLLFESSDLSDELDSSSVQSRLPRLKVIPWNEFFVGSVSSRGDNIETAFSVEDESSECDGTCDFRCWLSGLFNMELRNHRISSCNAFRRLWRIRLRCTRIIVRMTMLKRSVGTIEKCQRMWIGTSENKVNARDLRIQELRRPWGKNFGFASL